MIGSVITIAGVRYRVVYEELVTVDGPKGVYSYVVVGTERA